MQKKKAAKKKKKTSGRTSKSRLQKVNKLQGKEMHPSEAPTSESSKTIHNKVICFNVECKLRRAGCYGYEACPGFKSKG